MFGGVGGAGAALLRFLNMLRVLIIWKQPLTAVAEEYQSATRDLQNSGRIEKPRGFPLRGVPFDPEF